MNKLKLVEQGYLKQSVPTFGIGDSVDVHVKIKEGERERIQIFSGTVIARKGHGINEMFCVRRIVAGEGVERLFPIHSPAVGDIVVTRRGKVRRAKLYYLRDRVGKAVKVREQIGTIEEAEAKKKERDAQKKAKEAEKVTGAKASGKKAETAAERAKRLKGKDEARAAAKEKAKAKKTAPKAEKTEG